MSWDTGTAGEPPVLHDPDHPPVEEIELTTVLAALAEPARLTILRTVATTGEASCSDIWERTGLGGTKSTMSHHYKVLREAGVLHMRYVGSRKFATIRRADLDTRWPGLLDAVLRD
ncbi:helix-turn-helix transcriptional regulator [Solihabitans fulvus]|uniref:Helix-turn-helix transcriptional regulator n=1 Tax=Solihabitans fulvus TaxID=1892852 RepID=A0A5B2XAF8_9PSEU|nr:helix-turn-helix domain-containing protein [Solihabitans fulvus]KAA2260668.1 helix-turn-helix transcriptional regulator [Solihabitans fulvus]